VQRFPVVWIQCAVYIIWAAVCTYNSVKLVFNLWPDDWMRLCSQRCPPGFLILRPPSPLCSKVRRKQPWRDLYELIYLFCLYFSFIFHSLVSDCDVVVLQWATLWYQINNFSFSPLLSECFMSVCVCSCSLLHRLSGHIFVKAKTFKCPMILLQSGNIYMKCINNNEICNCLSF